MASQAGDTARERSAPITMRAAARMMEEHDVATTSARNKRLKSDESRRRGGVALE